MREAEGEDAEIWASQSSDCKLLHREHINCDALDDLNLRFDVPLLDDINGSANQETLEEWHSAIRHVLETFQPRQMTVHFGSVRPEIEKYFIISLPDGRVYSALLTQKEDCLHMFW